ncbi:MAG: LysR family transcriptional regulator [Saprospiraceae bacterium]|nr:LysR family transcriptional regulator [Saprospiraceae bacterium]MBP7642596.1 LysR family transcriptional regulator [Saprospiraceae bacterium]
MSNQLEFRHIKYFLAVAEDLHFRKAADRLFISQPGLSRQIKEMEDELGIMLFKRHNRKVELTVAGRYLQSELSKQLHTLEHIMEHAKHLHQGKDGSLKLGYVGSAMQHVIPDLLVKFRETHPNVIFGLKEMENDKQVEKLLSHELDLGFVRLERIPRGLQSKVVLVEKFCLVLPKHHKMNTNNFQSLSKLKDESFILFDPEYSASYYEKVMQIFDDSGFSPMVSHNTVHASSIFKLVENGFGISIVPESLQADYYPGIKFITLEKITQRTVLSAVWDRSNSNPTLEQLLEFI